MCDPASVIPKPQGVWASLICEGVVHALSRYPSGQLISIVIPVKNGATCLRELLPRILSQRTDHNVEIVAVDSGSTDSTVDVLRQYGATAVSIDPGSFNNGSTLNLAASYTRGDVLVFMTQRALPADNRWLANLIAPLGEDPQIAAAYSRCLPRPDVDLLAFRERLLRGVANWSVYRGSTPSVPEQCLRFSNVSSAIRREVLARIPFRPVSICAEDMLWAKEVLEAGLKIRYQPSSVILHAHDYSYSEVLRRHFDIGLGQREVGGLRLGESEILPAIVGPVRDEWHYLEHWFALGPDELEHWRIASVLRRTAYVAGLWLGANEDRLPSDVGALLASIDGGEIGPLTQDTRSYLELLRRYFEIGAADRQKAEAAPDESDVVLTIFAGIRDAWRDIDRRGHVDRTSLEQSLIDAALRQIAAVVGRWLGANQDKLLGGLRTSFSLVETIKAGMLIREMRHETDDAPTSASTGASVEPDERQGHEVYVGGSWQADLTALYTTIDALQAELLATRAELQVQVDECNRIINGLQVELHSKVGECNRIIRELQAELRPVRWCKSGWVIACFRELRRMLSRIRFGTA